MLGGISRVKHAEWNQILWFTLGDRKGLDIANLVETLPGGFPIKKHHVLVSVSQQPTCLITARDLIHGQITQLIQLGNDIHRDDTRYQAPLSALGVQRYTEQTTAQRERGTLINTQEANCWKFLRKERKTRLGAAMERRDEVLRDD